MLLQDKNLYYVGGVVRDEFLGLKSLDTDFCYEGNAIEFTKGMNVVKTNPSFGTVRIKHNQEETDIASTREESYPKPGHLPVVTNIGCPLKDDLKRRDFTINAMAKNTVSKILYDPFYGKDDIDNNLLRVLHPNSFIDDPTRIIRGLKFSVRFGFQLEAETKKYQDSYLENVNYDMSFHRIKKELIETFNLNLGKAFDIFQEQHIYKLLGAELAPYNIKGEFIQKAITEANIKDCWIIYTACLKNISTSPLTNTLTRKEKKVLEWTERLESQKPTNNTPVESMIIFNLLKECK